MSALLRTRSTAIWLLLVVATLLSWAMGHGFAGPSQAGVAILVIALIKFRCILFEFMELRDAPKAMRLAGNLWCLLLAIVLVGLFLAGTP